MLVSKLNEIFVIGQEPISMNAMGELRVQYIINYKWEPEILRLSPLAKDNLLANLPESERSINYDTCMGMKIEVDSSLKDNEWRIGKSNEIYEEVPRL